MKLDTMVKTLGSVDHAAMKTAVEKITPDAWLEDSLRQKSFDVHAQTQSVILLFADGWPELRISQRKGWDEFAGVALPVMREIIGKHYTPRGTVIRAVFAKLVAGGVIDEHYDGHPSFAIAHRIHVPLVTSDDIDFTVGGEVHHLKEGIAYEISNLDQHSVVNRSDKDRVHFIFDYAPDDGPGQAS